MKVKAPFAGHPAASSAWPPAVTPSLLGGLESHCKKEKQWHFVKSKNFIWKLENALMKPRTIWHWTDKSTKVKEIPLVLHSSNTGRTFQFAWLVVELSVTLAASELVTLSLLPLMKPGNTQRSIYSNCYGWQDVSKYSHPIMHFFWLQLYIMTAHYRAKPCSIPVIKQVW